MLLLWLAIGLFILAILAGLAAIASLFLLRPIIAFALGLLAVLLFVLAIGTGILWMFWWIFHAWWLP